MTTAGSCPQCTKPLLRPGWCECGWTLKTDDSTLEAPKGCDRCGAEVRWINRDQSLCWQHYEAIIAPKIPATAAEIAFHKRHREIEAWIAKHPEFKTKREACLHMLSKRGLTNFLPQRLREQPSREAIQEDQT